MSTPVDLPSPNRAETTNPGGVIMPEGGEVPATATGVAAAPIPDGSDSVEGNGDVADVDEGDLKSDEDGGVNARSKPKKKGKDRSIPKELRQNKKNWADGVRSSILTPHLEGYGKAKRLGRAHADEYLQRVFNEYHFHIPANSPDFEEPPLPLREYDPKAPLPDDSHLTEAERLAKASYIEKTNKASHSRIRTWLDYRVSSTRHRAKAKSDGLKQAYGGTMAKLTGVQHSGRPRLGYQQLMREDFKTRISPLLAREWAKMPSVDANGKPKASKPPFSFGAVVARRLWENELPETLTEKEKEGYEGRAREEFAAAKTEREAMLNAEADKTPRGRQNAIDNVDTFAEEFAEGIADATGLHVVLLLGGPIPAYGGEIRTICISVGENTAAAPVSFPQWQGHNFDKNVVKPFKQYLATAFSERECAAASLPPEECVGYDGDDVMDISDPEPVASSSKAESVRGKGKDGARSSAKGKGKGNEVADSEDEQLTSARADILNDPTLERMSVDSGPVASGGSPPPPTASDSRSGSDSEDYSDDEGDDEGDDAEGTEGKRKATGENGREKKRRKRTEETEEGKEARHDHSDWLRRRNYMKSVEEAKARNLKLLEEIGLREAAAGFGKPKPQQPRAPRKPRVAAEGPPRRSGRNAPSEIQVPQAPEEDVDASGQAEDGPAEVVEEIEGGEKERTDGERNDEESASGTVDCPSDVAGWLATRWTQISGPEDNSTVWSSLLRDFVALERAYDWKDDGALLSTQSRPDPVSAWVRNGRRPTTKIQIPNLVKYEQRWWAWWRNNQPAWRKDGNDDASLARPDVDGGNWSPLNAPGQNGMLLVVASLFWWGRQGGRSAGWLEAVEEVRWAIGRLTLAAKNS
ncbi:hypothetical protein C8F01DRAFT_1263640 [Mycena amicta]|nr:hypothetical protein C8F01DRAFT_1263640 [Mycena amicta]